MHTYEYLYIIGTDVVSWYHARHGIRVFLGHNNDTVPVLHYVPIAVLMRLIGQQECHLAYEEPTPAVLKTSLLGDKPGVTL